MIASDGLSQIENSARFCGVRPETVRYVANAIASESSFRLPATFSGGCFGAETLFIMNFIWTQRHKIRNWIESIDAASSISWVERRVLKDRLRRVVARYVMGKRKRGVVDETDIGGIEDDLYSLASSYNRHARLKTSLQEKRAWPRENLRRMEQRFPSGLLPPPLPSEYVEPKFIGSWLLDSSGGSTGQMASRADWLGHGYAYYSRPRSVRTIANTGLGDTCSNFDVLEDNYVRLKKARVFCADYDLLRRDFPDSVGGMRRDEDIDRWILDNAAFISEGQLGRIRKGGDLHDLLEVENPLATELVDVSVRKSALRQRSGGRAATFFAGDRYAFDRKTGDLRANLLDVKGVGTHKNANVKKISHTGLLGMSDALRCLAMQRLIQRICELEGEQTRWNTVQFYAIVDTGLRFRAGTKDPATLVEGQVCVLAIRQAQSRLGGTFESFDFSAQGGNLLLAGDTESLCTTGNARRIREVLERYGVSAEMFPSRFVDEAICRNKRDHLDDASSCWNLQADAPLTHFLDFSDYFVFPDSCLRHEWHLTTEAVLTGVVFSFNTSDYTVDTILGLDIGSSGIDVKPKRCGPGLPSAMLKVFKTSDRDEAYRRFVESWRRFSKSELHRSLATKITEDGSNKTRDCDPQTSEEGIIPRGKSCGSMNWFMELDVMTGTIWKWGGKTSVWRAKSTPDILRAIEAWLPTRRAPRERRLGFCC
eukprot:g1827.t1